MEKVLGHIDVSLHNVIFEEIHTDVKSQLTPLLKDALSMKLRVVNMLTSIMITILMLMY